MTTNEVRDLIAEARTETAVQAVLQLTASTDLENLAIKISRSYRKYKRKVISGILSTADERQEEALITDRLLNLLNEYEILQIKNLKNNFDQLRFELEGTTKTAEVEDTVEELNKLNKELDEINSAISKEDVKPGTIGKIGQFLNRLKDPNSKEHKAIQVVKNGISIAQDLAKGYNSIAEWFALPQVPKLFLKKST